MEQQTAIKEMWAHPLKPPLGLEAISMRVLEAEKKKRKNYAGSKTLPASIMEKEAHWPEVL